MADWRPAFPINFNPVGDMTSQAIFKHIQELSKVYEHLNYLRSNVAGGASLTIDGVAPDVASLPNTEAVGAIYLVNGKLYAWDGETWVEIGAPTLPMATTEIPGIVRLGTLAGLMSDTPSTGSVVTEAMLSAYKQGSERVPSGVICMWYGLASNVPPGWVVCDGQNGTPDLMGRFPVGVPNASKAPGTMGGNNSMILTVHHLPSHGHDFRGTAQVSIGDHQHGVNIASGPQSANHTHTVDAATDTDGEHLHRPADPSTLFYTGNKNPALLWLAGSNGRDFVAPSVNSAMFPMETTDGAAHRHHFRATTDGVSADHQHHVSGNTSPAGAANASAAVSGQVGNAGGGGAFDIRPAYCELLFIMKL